MKEIKQIEVEGEQINLQKGMFGYRIVHPNKINEKTIWINVLIGGWANFWKLIFIMLVILAFLFGANVMVASCREMAKNPCNYFDLDCSRDNFGQVTPSKFLVGDLNEG
tara:strand:- start:2167 stop:2493 length:327 start_codon:yes stop_codon:yes gene_type:complete